MQDSDAVDEAEAAHQATRAEQIRVVDDLIAHAEGGGEAQFVGEIVAFGRTLFFWEDLGGTSSYINLDKVTIVNYNTHEEGNRLEVLCGGDTAWTTDEATIARFWAEWEII